VNNMPEKYEKVVHPPIYKKGGDVALWGKHPVARIIFDGIFDWEGLYEFIVEWYKNRRYYFEEADYKYKVPTMYGTEEEFKWSGWRNVTDYYRYWVHLYIQTFDTRKIEVVENGKKKTMYRGRFILEFRGVVETDYQGRFKDSLFAHNVKGFLDRFIFFKPMDVVWNDRLYYIILKFHARVKEHVDMTSKGHAYEDVW